MTDDMLPKVENAGRALLVIQAALNMLIVEGTLTKKDIVDSINETFSPSDGSGPKVAVEHPSETHAILGDFVSGLTIPPKLKAPSGFDA